MQRSRPGSVTARPRTSTTPRSAGIKPAMIRIKVVLPQPLGPSSDTNSFFRMETETLYSATSPGLRGSFCSKKTLLSCRTSSIQPPKPWNGRGSRRSLSPEFLDRPVNKAPVEEILERYRCFEVTDFLEKLDGVVVGFFREIPIDTP